MVEEAIVASWLLLERVSAHPDESKSSHLWCVLINISPLVGPALQRVWPVLDSHSFTAERTVSNAPLHGKLIWYTTDSHWMVCSVQQTLIKLCQCVLLSSSGTPPVAKPWLAPPTHSLASIIVFSLVTG